MRALKRGSRRGTGARAGLPARARRRPGPSARRPRPVQPATVLVHPGVLRAIASATIAAGALETGGPLVGAVQRSWGVDGRPRLIISLLGTVPPGPAQRATRSSVSLGRKADGERAASAIRWWRAVTDLDLLHLGDWHKHDRHCPEPSGGDRATAKEMSAEAAGPVWLAAIAVGERSETVEAETEGNRARLARAAGDCEHVRFYRAVPGRGLVAMPIRIDGHALPALPALPWHVVDPARFAAECRLLASAGFSVAIEPAPSPTRPGLALNLRRDGERWLTVITSRDYPDRAPVLRDPRGKRIKTSEPWSPARFLVDLVGEAR